MTDNQNTATLWAEWNRRHDVFVAPDDFERACGASDPLLVSGRDTRLPDMGEVRPDFLYLRGNLDHLSTPMRIAVVGSRHSGVEGQRLARWVSEEVVLSGGIVCSGGAIGTDTIAHEAAVHRNRPTICVMPSGIDVATPRRNRKLFESIATNGCLVSAYPLGVSARPYHYHARNALLVALSDAVIVVRARAKSGSRITGEAALAQKKPLFVLPGSPDDPHSRGCLDLLEKGARMFRSIDDLGFLVGTKDPAGAPEDESILGALSLNARTIVIALKEHGGSATADELAQAVGLAPSIVGGELVELELWGVCSRPPGGSVVSLARPVSESGAK
jgi:DNA processing protein